MCVALVSRECSDDIGRNHEYAPKREWAVPRSNPGSVSLPVQVNNKFSQAVSLRRETSPTTNERTAGGDSGGSGDCCSHSRVCLTWMQGTMQVRA